MIHLLNHHEKLKKITDKFGAEGYGSYWILNELIMSSPNKSLSRKELSEKSFPLVNPVVLRWLISDEELFHPMGDSILSSLDRTTNLSVDMAYSVLDKAGLRGRGFSKIMMIHSVSEKVMMREFESWKVSKTGENFKDEKHVFNSFNKWMSNARKEESIVKEERDWSKFK